MQMNFNCFGSIRKYWFVLKGFEFRIFGDVSDVNILNCRNFAQHFFAYS